MKMLTPNEHHTFESEIEKNECLKAHGFKIGRAHV